MMSAAPVVELEGIGKTYYTGDVATPVLFDISFSIVPGEFVAIVGGSGSGKTTLLNLMGLLDRPSAGHIRVEERDVHRLAERPDALGLQPLHRLRHLPGVAGADGDVRTLVGERLGDRPPDPAARARDHHRLALELQVHRRPSDSEWRGPCPSPYASNNRP